MPILPRVVVALLALLSLLAARQLHRQQQALLTAPIGFGASPSRLPARGSWRPAPLSPPCRPATVAGLTAAGPMRLFFLHSL